MGLQSYAALSELRQGKLSGSRGDALRSAARLPLAFISRAFGALQNHPGTPFAVLRFQLNPRNPNEDEYG
jgi:hypothetical protein